VAAELTMWLRELDEPEYMEQVANLGNGAMNRLRSIRRRCLHLLKLVAVLLAPKSTINAPRFWASTLERLTLSLADQQLITGLLIATTALIRYIPISDLSSLAVASDAAIFSSITHLASLRTLRKYLREHPRMTVCRLAIAGMTSALIISSYAYQVARENWYSSYGVQLGLLIWLSWSVILSVLISDLALKARSAFDLTWSSIRYIDTWIQSVNVTGATRNPITALALLLCKWYMVGGVSRAFITDLAEVLFPWYLLSPSLWLFFGFSVQAFVYDIASSASAETWGFGQLLPTFLILLPFFTLIETYGGLWSTLWLYA
jgi:hypothetical protein